MAELTPPRLSPRLPSRRRALAQVFLAVLLLAVGTGCRSTEEHPFASRAYHDPSFGWTAAVAPEKDMVIVITASLPEDAPGALSVPRWLAETYILPAAR